MDCGRVARSGWVRGYGMQSKQTAKTLLALGAIIMVIYIISFAGYRRGYTPTRRRQPATIAYIAYTTITTSTDVISGETVFVLDTDNQ